MLNSFTLKSNPILSRLASYDRSTNQVKREYIQYNTTTKRSKSTHNKSGIHSEIEKFAKIGQDWWTQDSQMELLHGMNPVRVKYIKEKSIHHFGLERSRFVLDGLNVLDVGSGGGILSESLARIGGCVTGIDVSQENVDVATSHAMKDPLFDKRGSPKYVKTFVEDYVLENKESFDIVCCLEVLEHVDNVPTFVENLCQLVKPGGCLFLSTINRTQFSYLMTKLFAEKILKWVPEGTHEWERYITPTELQEMVTKNGCIVEDTSGMIYNPIKSDWSLGSVTESNYIMYTSKPKPIKID
eukprot:TRINITY_DN4068_c0_g2_i1.p1 TRINITY_DN4068_c0_g2~~TRINITY_DN4068_c0_g2_i1.p1  ORF type:complete len:315 (-),score=50.01 TRINITY_DN4068_c0_g2_i1:10-903(-)